MPDNGQPPDNEFDRRLEDLGDHVEYPPTPDLATSVREGLQGEDQLRPSLAGWVAAAVVVLISLPILAGIVFSGGLGSGGGAAVSSSDSGASSGGETTTEQADAPAEETSALSEEETMAEEEADQGLAESAGGTAASSASSSSAASSESLGEPFEFGYVISLKEARELSNPPLLLPTSPGYKRPDEIYVGSQPNQDGLVLVYGIRETSPQLGDSEIGAILTALDGGVQRYTTDTSATSIEEVTVGDGRGYWSPGGIGTTSPLGTAEELPGNVLVWESDGRALRLQADISKDKAIQIAESVR